HRTGRERGDRTRHGTDGRVRKPEPRDQPLRQRRTRLHASIQNRRRLPTADLGRNRYQRRHPVRDRQRLWPHDYSNRSGAGQRDDPRRAARDISHRRAQGSRPAAREEHSVGRVDADSERVPRGVQPAQSGRAGHEVREPGVRSVWRQLRFAAQLDRSADGADRPQGVVLKPMLRTFLEQPHRVAARSWMFQIHLWLGLALGVYVAAIGITGSVLIFRPEVEPALVDHTRHDGPAGRTFQAAWDNVRRAYPGHAIATVSLNQYPGTRLDDPYRVKLQIGDRTFFTYVD